VKKILALAAVSAVALAATPASAQSAPTGVRVGVVGGYDFLKSKSRTFNETVAAFDADLNAVTAINYQIGSRRDEGIVYGVSAGYDMGFGAMTLGIDLEATKSNVRLGQAVTTDFGNPALPIIDDMDTDDTADDVIVGYDPLRRRYNTKAGLDLYAGLRAGFSVGSNITLYGKAGYTRLRVRERLYDVDFTNANDWTLINSRSRNLTGYRVGLGAEFSSGMFYGGPEFRYSHYGRGFNRQQAVLTGGIRFGAASAPPPPPVEVAPPPPPPAAPATQTCPDGSVILATDVCPAPPAPPPPPPVERGERG
jgi:opacity protein-like surface antigen